MAKSEIKNECIEACMDCYRSCYETAVGCIEKGGEHSELAHLRILDECARICRVSAESIMSDSEFQDLFCDLCAKICARCAEDCGRFSGDRKMQECARSSERCATLCREIAGVAPGRGRTQGKRIISPEAAH